MVMRVPPRYSGISIHALREEGDLFFLIQQRQLDNFYPRPPRGGRHRLSRFGHYTSDISIHALREEGDCWYMVVIIGECDISIHALREEGDTTSGTTLLWPHDFYPRPPRGGRHDLWNDAAVAARFLSTPSARRATYYGWPEAQFIKISIHALREEGDPNKRRSTRPRPHYFYPRPPRGGRHSRCQTRQYEDKFLSTPSARRATPDLLCSEHDVLFLSTPSARRATDTPS